MIKGHAEVPSEDLNASCTLTIVETLPPIFGERLDLQTSHPSEVNNNRPWLTEMTSLQRSTLEFYTIANENELKTCSGVDGGRFAGFGFLDHTYPKWDWI